jgi:hypothetical protein
MLAAEAIFHRLYDLINRRRRWGRLICGVNDGPNRVSQVERDEKEHYQRPSKVRLFGPRGIQGYKREKRGKEGEETSLSRSLFLLIFRARRPRRHPPPAGATREGGTRERRLGNDFLGGGAAERLELEAGADWGLRVGRRDAEGPL